MDRLEAMSTFVAVAEAGGFSAAARSHGIPLATVSRRVADLEADLGVRLLHRSTRRIMLTEQGQIFFAACRRMLDDLKDAEAAIGGEYRTPKGDLTVSAPVGFGRVHLQPVALEFLAAFPEINLRLALADNIVNLVEDHSDAAVRNTDLEDSTLVARPVGSVRMVVCASPAYLKARGSPAHPRDLIAHDCIAWSSLGPQPKWWFREHGQDTTFSVRVRLATSLAESAVAAALAGLGVVQATNYQLERGFRDGTLQALLRDFECVPTPVNLVYPSSRLVPLKLRAFNDFVIPRLAERLRLAEQPLTEKHDGAKTSRAKIDNGSRPRRR